MRAPNRRHSEPRNTHMASFSLEIPVLVTWLRPCSAGVEVGLSSTVAGVIVIVRRLPSIHSRVPPQDPFPHPLSSPWWQQPEQVVRRGGERPVQGGGRR